MIDKIDSNQIADILEKTSPTQPNTAKNASNDAEDALLQVEYASLIDQAQQIPQEQSNAVQRAQELLGSGELESPENIQEAAEKIIEFGI
ncbi:MAG: hypothetical protein ACYS0I_00270 [Planctomycetota bacterium]|jgi:hypothetical protein